MKHLDKLGSAGAIVAAAACPVCFPKLALLGTFFGLGAFSAYEAQLFIAAQALVLVAVAGHVLAYRQHGSAWPLGSALVSGAAVFAGLTGASVFGPWRRLSSVLTCPKCGSRRRERMPRNACQFFYECRSCGGLLRPLPGDCCVFCSYGSVGCRLRAI